jgi:hypothetical protein
MHSTFAEIPAAVQIRSYLLRSGSHYRPLRSSLYRWNPLAVLDHSRLEPFADQAEDPLIGDPMFEETEHPHMIDFIEK